MLKRTFLKTLFGGLAGTLLPQKTESTTNTQPLHRTTLLEEFGLDYDTEISLARQERALGDIRQFGNEIFDTATKREVLQSGMFGHLFTADIHMSHRKYAPMA